MCARARNALYDGESMAVTLKEIAEIAQVSRGTVDRVLHGRYGVDPQTRARVLTVMKDMNYNPNLMARALRGMQHDFRIGVIVPSAENNPFYLDVHAGIDEAARMAASYGMEVVKIELNELDAEQQIRSIDQLVARGVCGIALVPVDDCRVRERINALPESIPVITFNSDIAGTNRMCFVGNDHVRAGCTAGHLMSIVVREPGKIALLISQPDMQAHVERIEGFRRIFDGLDGMEMIGPQFTYESEERAFQVVNALLRDEPRLAGVYVAGGGQQAAARALAQSGRAGGVHMICHDMLPETVRSVREGVVDFTIGQEAFKQGYLPVEIFRDYHMFGRKPAVDRLYTRIDIRSRENIAPEDRGVSAEMYAEYWR